MNSICPWCDTEIVWDPEFGPEDTCPHCYNELKEYRSIELKLNQKDKHMEANIAAEQHWDKSMEEIDNAEVVDSQDLLAYEEAVEEYLDVQYEAIQCPICREYMVYSGEQRVEANEFTAFLPSGFKKPFLKAPFTLRVHVCPSCFQVSHMLSEEDRMRILTHRRSH